MIVTYYEVIWVEKWWDDFIRMWRDIGLVVKHEEDEYERVMAEDSEAYCCEVCDGY